MDLKQLVIDVIEKELIPFIDNAVKQWTTPYEIDDAFWAVIRERIKKHLDSLKDAESLWGAASHGAIPIKAIVISFCETVVFPIIDEYVKERETAFEWDDKAWAILKVQIRKYLDNLSFQEASHRNFAYAKGSV